MTGFDLFQNLPSKFDFGSFQCYECNLNFTDPAEALSHLMGHLPKESYDDIESDKTDEYDPGEFDPFDTFSPENESDTRQKYIEMANQPCEIDCPNCNENFKSMAAWGNHFNDVHKNKCDDIPVSTSIENVSSVKIGSTSPYNESSQNVDFDPPSPVYTVRNMNRIRASSFSESDSGVNVLAINDAQIAIEKKDEPPKENFD